MAQTARKKDTVDYEAHRTRDHDTIRRWAEERGGHPAMVEGTEILRIDFDEPGGNDDVKLRRVSWDEFFRVFDNRELEFLYQDRTHDGNISRFNKFVRSGSDEEQS
jgi:hypothetical protein